MKCIDCITGQIASLENCFSSKLLSACLSYSLSVINNLVSIDNRAKVEVKAENQDRGYKKPVHSKETQQLILESFYYFCKSISKKYGATTVYF